MLTQEIKTYNRKERLTTMYRNHTKSSFELRKIYQEYNILPILPTIRYKGDYKEFDITKYVQLLKNKGVDVVRLHKKLLILCENADTDEYYTQTNMLKILKDIFYCYIHDAKDAELIYDFIKIFEENEDLRVCLCEIGQLNAAYKRGYKIEK